MSSVAVENVTEESFAPSAAGPVLQVRDLVTEFRTGQGPLRANDRISFDLEAGEVLGILGESGSGKSAMLRTILGIQPKSTSITGQVLLNGVDILALSEKERRETRGRKIAMVFQNPLTALDPVYTVRQQLVETIRVYDDPGAKAANARALELLNLVQIPSPERRLDAYPFELSGGMRQRVVIAAALACRPSLLLADEPTTALDVTVQARVLELLNDLRKELNMSVIFVTHDLAVAASISDRVAVMYAGRVVETGTVDQLAESATHPYTKGLIAANVEPGQTEQLIPIPGSPPNLAYLPPGCAFAPRCNVAVSECWNGVPELVSVGEYGWKARCILVPDYNQKTKDQTATDQRTGVQG